MHAFDFQTRTKVAFGIERSKLLAEDIRNIAGGTKVVLVTDPGLVQLGVAAQVMHTLEQGGFDVSLFSDVASDPSSASIDLAANCIRETDAQCVIGLGGGSAMDVAKLASMVAGAAHPAEHYALMANPFAPRRVKSIMIPTTSGTGAEVTSTVVFSTKEKRKVWGWDVALAPDLAILDPTFTVALPTHLTAATGLDAIVHAIEAAAGHRGNPMIHALSMEAIRLLAGSLMTAIQTPEDLTARGNLSIGSMLAGLAIEQGGTGIGHCIGHALGTLARVHHGRAVAIALYETYAWNVLGNTEVHADIARAFGIADTGQGSESLALAGAAFFRGLVEQSGITLSLQGEKLTTADSNRLVAIMESDENQPMRNNNCRASAETDLRAFAEAIFSR